MDQIGLLRIRWTCSGVYVGDLAALVTLVRGLRDNERDTFIRWPGEG